MWFGGSDKAQHYSPKDILGGHNIMTEFVDEVRDFSCLVTLKLYEDFWAQTDMLGFYNYAPGPPVGHTGGRV